MYETPPPHDITVFPKENVEHSLITFCEHFKLLRGDLASITVMYSIQKIPGSNPEMGRFWINLKRFHSYTNYLFKNATSVNSKTKSLKKVQTQVRAEI